MSPRPHCPHAKPHEVTSGVVVGTPQRRVQVRANYPVNQRSNLSDESKGTLGTWGHLMPASAQLAKQQLWLSLSPPRVGLNIKGHLDQV